MEQLALDYQILKQENHEYLFKTGTDPTAGTAKDAV